MSGGFATRPHDSAYAEPSLKFITFQRPSDAKSLDARKQVRSHVTRVQHHQSRQRYAKRHAHQLHDLLAADPLRSVKPASKSPSAQSKPGSVGSARTAVHSRREAAPKKGAIAVGDARSGKRKDTQAETDGVVSQRLGIKDRDAVISREQQPLDAADDPAMIVQQQPEDRRRRIFKICTSISQDAFSNGTVAFRTFVLDDPENIVGTVLNRLQYDVASVLGFYSFLIGIQSRDFEQHYQVAPGIAHARYLAFLAGEPVLLACAILLSLHFLLANRSAVSAAESLVQVLSLRGFLIRLVNAALDDPVRAISDQMLVTVTLLAAHELKYRSLQGYHVHMRGLVKMINLRGGLPEIGRQDAFLEKFLIWHDAHSTDLAGCDSYVQYVERPSKVSRPRGDKHMFQMHDAMK